jgi:surfactin synthase thioesterase subunit
MLTAKNLVPLTPRESPAVRLVCFPHAGAGVAAFKMWSERVRDDVELIVVRLPGREMLFEQTPLREMASIGAAVAGLVAGLDGPVGLFGYCAGAFAAFETARQMTAAPALLAVCSQVAPQCNSGEATVHDLPGPRLKEALREMGGTEPVVLENEEYWALTEPAIRADYEAAETYATGLEPKVSCDVLAIRGSCDDEVSPEGLRAWAEVTAGTCATRQLDGGHFLLKTRAAEVLAEVERRLPGRST